jgi:hypothetical protein
MGWKNPSEIVMGTEANAASDKALSIEAYYFDCWLTLVGDELTV